MEKKAIQSTKYAIQGRIAVQYEKGAVRFKKCF